MVRSEVNQEFISLVKKLENEKPKGDEGCSENLRRDKKKSRRRWKMNGSSIGKSETRRRIDMCVIAETSEKQFSSSPNMRP